MEDREQMEMDDKAKLAVLQALYKVIAKAVSTGDKHNLRGRVDAKLRESYEQDGTKSQDIRIGGKKVGTISAIVKDDPLVDHDVFELVDVDKLEEWCADIDAEWFADYVMYGTMDAFETLRDFAQYYFTKTGEMPDGCEIAHYTSGSGSSYVKSTTVRVDPQKVYEAAGRELPSITRALLTDGGDE